MYQLKEATCDGCRTVYRSVSKKHFCSHCSRYYYICNRCVEGGSHCPDCGVPLKRKSPPLDLVKGRVEAAMEMNHQRRQRYFGKQ